jgi:hypothetical protein
MSTPIIFMSRAYVEFGPFTLEEFHMFKDRGIFRDTDYFRKEGESSWLHVIDFAVANPLTHKTERSGTNSDAVKTSSSSANASSLGSKAKLEVATKGGTRKPASKKAPKKRD